MFDKIKFSKILNNINTTYDSMSEFAKVAKFDRGYISKYISGSFDNPPSPKILKKLSQSSKGITTYNELMQICGYFSNLSNESSLIEKIFDEKISIFNKYHITETDIDYLKEILITRNENDYTLETQLSNFAQRVNCSDFEKGLTISDLYNDLCILNNTIIEVLDNCKKTGLEYPIPLYDNVKYSNISLIDGNIVKYINLNINSFQISELSNYFGILAFDNSMAPLLDIGDIAILYKQSSFESGGTYLLRLDTNTPIIRKILSIDNYTIELHAMNMWNYPVQKNILKSKIDIIGKVIQVENRSAFK